MIPPQFEHSRLAEAIKNVEDGEAVDWNRLAKLQALDLAEAGRQFTIAMLRREEEQNERLAGD